MSNNIILLFFLFIPSYAQACWDDDDTNWNNSWDDEWDIDNGELDEVEIIGDSHWFIDDLDSYYDDDENYDDDNDDWTNDDTDENSVFDITGFNYTRKSYTIQKGDFVVRKNIPQKWPKQETKNTCVITAMEYASKIITESDIYGRFYFAFIYQSLFGGDVQKYGVNSNNLNLFFNEAFDIEYIYTLQTFYEMIDMGYCILAILDEGYTAHEILIIGYTEDKKELIGIDPADGITKKYSYYELKGINYAIKRVK